MRRVFGGSSDGFATYDPVLGCEITRIHAGGYCVVSGDAVISTLLGSCVAICLWDPVARVAGMNHYLLPWEGDEKDVEFAARQRADHKGAGDCRYGVHAVSSLIDSAVLMGASMSRLQAKVFGGGVMLNGVTDIGSHNVRFADDILSTLGIPVTARDVGGRERRVIRFYSDSGKVMVCRGDKCQPAAQLMERQQLASNRRTRER